MKVDPQSGGFGGVHHVDRQDDWYVHLQHLQRQIQVALEVGGVEDADGRLGLARKQIGAAYLLLGGVGGKRVDAGQIDDPYPLVLPLGAVYAFVALDGDAGPVADVFARAGEGIEKGGLPRIGVADERDGFHIFSTSTDSASLALSVSS